MEKPTKICDESCQISSRRKFIKNSLITAGAITLGGWSLHALSNTRARNGRVTPAYRPKYLDLAASGELERRERALWEKMENCSLCPRMCGINRTAGEKAVCNSDHTLRVASSGIAFNVERAIAGRRGIGSIFMSNCNLLCIFCQNWRINHRGDGTTTTHTELANMMLQHQRGGAHTVGIVTPTHMVPHIVSALRLAVARGLNIPLVFSTGGYDSLEMLQLLDGIVDVYVSSFKFQDSEIAARFQQGAPDYVYHTAIAIKEMHRQVGNINIDNGVANRGLLIRHLVLPENLAGTDKFVRWAVDELGADTDVSIMAQYRPEHRARYHPPLDRRITQGEFNRAMRWAREAGLRNFH
jgi:putative pyruvate formate lyase activating enzyme